MNPLDFSWRGMIMIGYGCHNGPKEKSQGRTLPPIGHINGACEQFNELKSTAESYWVNSLKESNNFDFLDLKLPIPIQL